MMISFFMPVVSGNRRIRAGSEPATTAAACSTSPLAEPPETKPASAPVASAMALLAARFRSSMFTIMDAALFIASMISGRIFEPPYCVVVPDAVITLFTPSEL